MMVTSSPTKVGSGPGVEKIFCFIDRSIVGCTFHSYFMSVLNFYQDVNVFQTLYLLHEVKHPLMLKSNTDTGKRKQHKDAGRHMQVIFGADFIDIKLALGIMQHFVCCTLILLLILR